jgi:hypothetical protein
MSAHAIDSFAIGVAFMELGVNEQYREEYGLNSNGVLMVRRDKLLEAGYGDHRYARAALQPIFGGYRRSIFHYCKEEHFRRFIHHQMLNRAGLHLNESSQGWWSDDPASKPSIAANITASGRPQVTAGIFSSVRGTWFDKHPERAAKYHQDLSERRQTLYSVFILLKGIAHGMVGQEGKASMKELNGVLH